VTIFEVAESLRALALTFLVDPPAHTYTTVGEVSWDCKDGQLVASIRAPATSTGLGSASPSAVLRCLAVPLWQVCIELVRCVPTGTPPTEDALSISAEAVSGDMEALFYGLLGEALDGTLLDEPCSLSSLSFEVVGPSGGMVGIRGCVTFEMSRPTGVGS
jgi:hypothetical protein